jgi:allantoin racemase
MFGAGIARGLERGGRFAIITTVESAVPGIERLAAAYGAAHLCTIRAAGVGVAETAARTPLAEIRLAASIERAITEDRAEAIVLGSGALTGRAEALAKRFGIPFIDGLTEAIISTERKPES